ncbi:chaperone protein hscA-like protein [Ehrlichia ruminantium]|uniref:Fe-S protein assembly chaperone HscA n=1 Tax=Ehrlichia ruminantium TaxID=779 RepID=UPI0007C1173E|nr:Fe-S protein assembly chaperone HscA [Ehrlichia ruminantium]QLK52345.1 Fe-S protein assembly chaperone HscA [Ehrlichia ruminantium]QLK54175.1 Fe-S protein assembly chaperone HscA [Ehrlichia ruminantium]QLK56927.1 Fe-S protein assembly chaperone HscA [Ehrlichia ruminantium]GAT76255.1 chaperone protein hscA-like protein [Ehrlichia ruminantium]
MKLINITEPQEKRISIAFGIDLGTTNSLISMVDDNGQIIIFKDQNGNSLIPSIVSYLDDHRVEVGKNHNDDKSCTISSVKRLMGKSIEDIKQSDIFFNIANTKDNIYIRKQDNTYVTPVEVSAEILKKLCQIVKDSSNLDVKKVVITVPAYFDEVARKATKNAAKLANLEVLRLLNEPTAAALAYGIEKSEHDTICMIYDLGGGTFDVSILKLHDGVFQVLATGGNTNLGGDDIDYLFAKFIYQKYQTKSRTKLTDFNKEILKELIDDVRYAKEYLSDHHSGTFVFKIRGKDFLCKVTRNELNDIVLGLVKETLDIVHSTISSISLLHKDIKKVILVGGATKMPIIKDMLNNLFHNRVFCDVDPEKIVAVGAALQAHYLLNPDIKNNLLIDTLPLSLGIETIGGIVEKIIPRNTPIPAFATQEFTTYVDGQNAIQIHVCQGEREIIEHNKSLAKFDLKGIPPLPAGSAKIQVEFQVDMDGLLTVSAQEKLTGIKQSVSINNTLKLDQKEIEENVMESVKNFNSDMDARLLAEQKIEGQRIISIIKKALIEDKDLISTSELMILNKTLEDAEKVLLTGQSDQIKDAINHVELQASNFIKKRMDFYLKKSIDNYNISS